MLPNQHEYFQMITNLWNLAKWYQIIKNIKKLQNQWKLWTCCQICKLMSNAIKSIKKMKMVPNREIQKNVDKTLKNK